MTVQLRQNAASLVATSTEQAIDSSGTTKGGIARGTNILTARGDVPIESLVAGDRIITRERGMAALVSVTRVAAPACSVRTDSLGLGRPERDTTVACDQHVIVRDWRAAALFDCVAALVPARRLADGKQIATFGTADFFRLDFGSPLTIYANGLETPTGRTEAGVVEISDAE